MTDAHFFPPPSPPAFLGRAELLRLAEQGHLAITLPPKLQSDVTAFFGAIDTFFARSAEDKAALYPGAANNLEAGYHRVPDEKQFLSIRYANPGGDPDLEGRIGTLWHDISHLLFRILFDVGRFLEIDNGAWYPMLENAMRLPKNVDAATPSLLRAFRYEPDRGISEPHLDVGLLTLCVGKGKGLELWDRKYRTSSSPKTSNGADSAPEHHATDSRAGSEDTSTAVSGWQDAPEVTILVGETLRVLSTNRVWAGMHRVVPNPAGRDSIVFALRPDLNAILDLRMFGGSGEVHACALWEMIRKGKYNVNAAKEVREEVKAKNRTMKEKAAQETD